ncbi:hypothetical protein F4859DRAFT_50643 [Xylaria cf. heliscus]|nr:hypothetical protein F4859DRAFT_50643 [Xylaria cf. heliscus]
MDHQVAAGAGGLLVGMYDEGRGLFLGFLAGLGAWGLALGLALGLAWVGLGWLGWAACLFQPCVSHQSEDREPRDKRARGVRDKTALWLPLPDGSPVHQPVSQSPSQSTSPQVHKSTSPPEEDAGFTVLAGALGCLGGILPLPYCAVVPCLRLQKHPCRS